MNGFYITKDSSNLVQIWNRKPKKIRVRQNDFIFGREDEIPRGKYLERNIWWSIVHMIK